MKPANHFRVELPEPVSEPSVKFPFVERSIGLCVDGQDRVQRRILAGRDFGTRGAPPGKRRKISRKAAKTQRLRGGERWLVNTDVAKCVAGPSRPVRHSPL